jgi:hypothetical protein
MYIDIESVRFFLFLVLCFHQISAYVVLAFEDWKSSKL